MDPSITATLVGVAFAALVSALGFISRGMRSDIRDLGSKVDTILFALVHAGLLSPQQLPGSPLIPPSPAAGPTPRSAVADDAPSPRRLRLPMPDPPASQPDTDGRPLGQRVPNR